MKPSVVEKIYAFLFFFFFTAQIFSPYIGQRTIYLEIIIAILNPFFISWVIKRTKLNRLTICVFLILVFSLTLAGAGEFIKIAASIISVLFLFYSYDRKVFYLKQFFVLSILLAILQFSLLYVNEAMAIFLGPQNLSTLLWGQYATPALTNFFDAFGFLPRVSGLSREAGFFASYLITIILLLIQENKKYNIKISNSFILLLSVAFIISFSKMSLLLVVIVVIMVLSRYIDKLSKISIIPIFIIVMMLLWSGNHFLLDYTNATFAHRFGGFTVLPSISTSDLIFGIDKLSDIRPIEHQFYVNRCIDIISDLDSFAGLSGFILQYGLIFTVPFFLIVSFSGLSSTGILLLLFLTINVQPDTNQNFVVFAYFICFKFFSIYKKEEQNNYNKRPNVGKPSLNLN